MNSIGDAIRWSGDAVISLFTLGRIEEHLPEGAFEISEVRPEGLEIFRMNPDPSARKMIVWEYDLTFQDASKDLVPYLLLSLERASAGADGVAWLAFEGSFHFDHLFTEDVAEQIYGYCLAGGRPTVVWDGEILKSGRWKRHISDVKYAVETGLLEDDLR